MKIVSHTTNVTWKHLMLIKHFFLLVCLSVPVGNLVGHLFLGIAWFLFVLLIDECECVFCLFVNIYFDSIEAKLKSTVNTSAFLVAFLLLLVLLLCFIFFDLCV